MPFISTIKRAFGFPCNEGDDYYDDEPLGIDATVTPLRERQATTSAPTVMASSSASSSSPTPSNGSNAPGNSNRPSSPQPKPSPAQSAMEQAIFGRVVEVFNASLPPFLAQSVDPEAQRHFLYETLDEEMRRYLDGLEAAMRERFDTQRDAQLSIERQKRALSERVHDLEKQVAAGEAENEQLTLENKSMANKLRVLSVAEKEGGTDAEVVAALRAKLDQANAKIASAVDQTQAIEKANRAADAARKALEEKEAALLAANAEIDKVREKMKIVEEIQRQVEGLEADRKAADGQMGKLRDQLAEKDMVISQKDASYKEQTNHCNAQRARISALEEQIDALREKEAQKEFEHSQAESAYRDQISKLNGQLSKFEVLRADLDQVEHLRKEASEAQELRRKAEELDQLKAKLEAEAAAGNRPGARRRGRPRKEADPLSDNLDRDSFTPDPSVKLTFEPIDILAEPTTAYRKTQEAKAKQRASRKTLISTSSSSSSSLDSEFGYHEPERGAENNNPAQMTLW